MSTREGRLAEGSLAEGSLAEGSLAKGSLAEGGLAKGSLAEGSLAEGSLARVLVPLTPPWIVFKPMIPQDLLRMNEVNLDSFTENFPPSFYQQYLCQWPELCITAWSASGSIVGYIIGKLESYDENIDGDSDAETGGQDSGNKDSKLVDDDDDPLWHGHVTALSVEQGHRGAGIAQELIRRLELVSQSLACHFVDLFVRESNIGAVSFYKNGGYSVFQVCPEYYSNPTENALDMRKQLPLPAA